MVWHKVTLSSKENLTLMEKKQYIDSMYCEEQKYGSDQKRNPGFLTKFNNAIGFKPVVSTIAQHNVVIPKAVESPEDYLSPQDVLIEHIQTPLDSNVIICFYLEDKNIVHPLSKYSYETKVIAEKWKDFLQKVFPHLIVTNECVDEIPCLSLKDYTLQYFYRNLSQDVNYTIEFRSEKQLTNDEMKDILTRIQELSNDKITIGQNYCSTCAEGSEGKEPYHIEIVYLTFYGRDEEQKTYEEYGESIYKIS